MHKLGLIALLAAACVLGGCENMSTAQKGAVGGAALGSGIGLVTGGSFGTVGGAGLIGGAVGYLGGNAIQNSRQEARIMKLASRMCAPAPPTPGSTAQAQGAQPPAKP